MTHMLKTGEIWLANLNPSKGTEPGKTRPVLILQDQALLDMAHPSTLIAPLTTHVIKNVYPLRITIKAQQQLKEDSDLLIDQIRAIDNKRLINGPLATIVDNQLQSVFDAISEVIGMKA